MHLHKLSGRLLATLSAAVLGLGAPGCAALVNGTHQTVRLNTNPAGGTVQYQGRDVPDGGLLAIQKDSQAPEVVVNGYPVRLQYEPDVWLIGDALLLIPFVVPGVVAFGVDFITGAWRHFHEPQVVQVPESAR